MVKFETNHRAVIIKELSPYKLKIIEFKKRYKGDKVELIDKWEYIEYASFKEFKDHLIRAGWQLVKEI